MDFLIHSALIATLLCVILKVKAAENVACVVNGTSCELKRAEIFEEETKLTNARNDDVKKLIIRGMRTKHLPVDIAENFPHLTEIDVQYCSVKHVSHRNLNKLRDLIKFKLLVTKVETVDADTFKGLSKLKLVEIMDNQIASLPSGIFTDLVDVEEISLHNNQLTELDATVFKHNKNLKVVILSYNLLTTLASGTFDSQTSLQKIVAIANEITTLPANLFKNCRKLEEISFGGNKLTEIPSISNLPLLKVLNFWDNQISVFDFAMFNDHELSYIQFDHNKIMKFRNINKIDQLSAKKFQLHLIGNVCVDDSYEGSTIKNLKQQTKCEFL